LNLNTLGWLINWKNREKLGLRTYAGAKSVPEIPETDASHGRAYRAAADMCRTVEGEPELATSVKFNVGLVVICKSITEKGWIWY